MYFSACTLCTLHVLTPNPPVILSGNDTIQLAPYHTYYPKLEEHMQEVGLGKTVVLCLPDYLRLGLCVCLFGHFFVSLYVCHCL